MQSQMILVTVGTTSFDALIRAVDQNLPREWNLHLQIADGTYIPKHFDWFRFSDRISDFYSQSAFVICHAGAGTVFRLLELRKRLVVVPNLTRADPHQRELAHFVDSNHYAVVCQEPTSIAESIRAMRDFDFKPFVKPAFSGGSLLLEKIEHSYLK